MTDPGGHADTADLLDSAGPAAPPRNNGELVFAAPWESQAFGLALALRESGQIDWEDFRQHLIAEIGTRESSGEWSYYRCWLTALERLAGRRGLVRAGDLRARAEALAAGPPGHGDLRAAPRSQFNWHEIQAGLDGREIEHVLRMDNRGAELISCAE